MPSRPVALAAGLLLAGAACSQAPEPLPPQSVARQPPAPEGALPAEPQPPAPQPTAPPPPEPLRAPGVITIEAAEEPSDDTQSLVEAARRERQRRGTAGAPIAVITDKNLQEHATGQLTFVDAAADEEAGPAGEQAGDGEQTAEERGEAYWRQRVRELRASWRAAADSVPELEEKAAELRRQFYDADDAYYRDSRIKPAWDRAIDQIAQTRAAADALRQELDKVLDEGRRAGALPGWLREGIELEPRPEPPPTDEHQPGEPDIVDVDDGGGAP